MIADLRDRIRDFKWAGLVWLALMAVIPSSANPQPFLQRHCIKCHDSDTAKGEFDLEALIAADWNHEGTPDQWERVLKRVREGEMPPPKKKKLPSNEERSG
ncbi:hypothetical protein OAK04_04055, partial [Verrucomicrobia bacterium]|nr:hypothetical protein [Verrucomicrobiota bacterium]